MGVLPLEFTGGQTWQSLGLTGEEVFDIAGLDDAPAAARHRDRSGPSRPTGRSREFAARVRIDTPVEIDYYRNGGILQTVLRKLL